MTADWKPVRILVVDDHPVVRQGLRSLLSVHPDFEVVGEAEDGAQILPWLADHEADLILLDIQMKTRGGIETARTVRSAYPSIRIIILTTFGDESNLREALEAGVDAYLLKSMSHESLPGCIRAVMAGEKMVSPPLMTAVMNDYQTLARERAKREVGLSADELRILAAIAEGASNKDLAEQFYWSEATVKRMIQDIIEKLGAANRTQAVAEAIRRGWI